MLGVILLIAFMFVITIKNEENKINGVVDPTISEPIRLYTENCIKETLEQGLLDIGFSNLPKLEIYLENNIRRCTNEFEVFSGLEIEEGIVSSDIDFTSDNLNLLVDVEYPITIKKGKMKKDMSKFHITYSLSSQVLLSISGNVVGSDALVYSSNMLASLSIPIGVSALDENGLPLDRISITLEDNSSFSGDILGFMAYDLQPDGATFDPPITLSIKYDESELSPILAEQELQISYYEDGEWVAWPSNVDVDNNIIYASVSHFTSNAVTAASGRFLWKPISENDGKLVVLTPVSGTASIYSSDGGLIETGTRHTSSGTNNGYVDGTRFSKQGGSYPDGCIVHIGSLRCLISETSGRVDRCIIAPSDTTSSTKAMSIRVWGYCQGTSSCPAGPLVDQTCTETDTCSVTGYTSSSYKQYEGEHYIKATSECAEQGTTTDVTAGSGCSSNPCLAFTINWDDNQGSCEKNGGTWLAKAEYCGSLGCYGGKCCGDDGNLDDFYSGDPGKCCKNAEVVEDCNICGCPSGYRCDNRNGDCVSD